MQQSSNQDTSLIFAENEVFGRSSLQLTALSLIIERGIAMIESRGKAALIQAKCMFSGMGIPLSSSLWAAQAYWACNALNFTAIKANPKRKSSYEMWYGRTPPSPFPFLKPGFVKRKRTNKLEPQAVPCFYVGPSPNRPRDSMRVIFSSGTMIDSRDVTWARIPPLTSVLCEQGGQEPTELQEMGSAEEETNPSDGESDDLQSHRQKSAGDEEDDDDEKSIFPLVVDPAPTRKATPVGRAAQSMPLATVCGTRSSMLAGLSCTKGVWYIYDWDTGLSILIW